MSQQNVFICFPCLDDTDPVLQGQAGILMRFILASCYQWMIQLTCQRGDVPPAVNRVASGKGDCSPMIACAAVQTSASTQR